MRSYNKTIFKLDRGQSFKGHSGELSIMNMGTGNGEVINIMNKYFMGYVSTQINPKMNSSSKIVTVYQPTPKWLQKKREDLLALCNADGFYLWEFKVDGMTYSIEPWNISISYTEEVEGCKVTGHKENIDELKNLNKILSKYKNYVKVNEVEKLMPYLMKKENWEDDVTDDVQTIPSLKDKLLNKIKGWFK